MTTSSYAIVESGGKQYRAEKGGMLLVDRLPAEEGAKVALRPVMYRGDEQVVLEAGELEKVKVEATVAEHLRGEKIRVFKYKPKKGYRRRAGHRSELTRLEVTEVKLLSRRPARAKAEEPKKAAGRKPAPSKKGQAKAASKKGGPGGAKGASKKGEAKPKPSARRRASAKKEG